MNKEKNKQGDVIKEKESNSLIVGKKIEHDQKWVKDTGASEHMCFSRLLFSSYKELKNPRNVRIGNFSELEAIGCGIVTVNVYNGVDWIEITLNNVLLVLKLAVNLFSVLSVMDTNLKMIFDRCKIMNMKNNK